LLKVGCVGAGLLSISNPTQVTAADIGLYDFHNDLSLGSIPNPFPESSLGVNIAIGDLDGDGFGDIVAGPGKGDPVLYVNKAKTMDKAFNAMDGYIRGLRAGVTVATGDINGDLRDDVIVGPAIGRGSELAALDFIETPGLPPTYQLIDSTDSVFGRFAGGVRVAVGDVDDDGLVDIAAGHTSCSLGKHCASGKHIKKATLSMATFNTFDDPIPDGAQGIELAMGDIDNDGSDEVLAFGKPSADGLAHAFLYNGIKNTWTELGNFIEPVGVHVAMGDIDGDGREELMVGAPRGVESYIHVYTLEEDPLNLGALRTKEKIIIYKPPGKYQVERIGVRVAAGDINGDGYADVAFAPASIPEPSTMASFLIGLGACLLPARRRRRDAAPG
jgi:hypothetical protein